MRSLILSQCRDLRIGVTREDLGALTTVRVGCVKIQHFRSIIQSTRCHRTLKCPEGHVAVCCNYK